jgi:glycosyltransferase involved in cell wall biosynthesis
LSNSRTVWVASELYYPEETSTGYIVTKIAEGLAEGTRGPVRALAAQPTYSARGRRAPKEEVHARVRIRRSWTTTFDKDVLPLRFLNLLTVSAAMFWNGLRLFRSGDVVFVVTNPPLLPLVIQRAARWRGAKTVLLIHDVYPEAMVAAGVVRHGGWLERVISHSTRELYRRSDRICVLGEDMARLVERKSPGVRPKIRVIPNWADLDLVRPSAESGREFRARHGLEGRFVLQYAGNMGRTHGLESVLEAATRLRERNDIVFLFIGSGGKREWLRSQARGRGLAGVRVLETLPRSEQLAFLNGCDMAVISFVPGMAGVSVPSRLYNVLAAGKPVLGVADEDSELARVIREEGVGVLVAPDRPDELAETIRNLADHPERVAAMAAKARAVAEREYPLGRVVALYGKVLEELDGAAGS